MKPPKRDTINWLSVGMGLIIFGAICQLIAAVLSAGGH